MSDIVIRVENLGKCYRLGKPQARYNTFRDSIAGTFKAPFRHIQRSGHTDTHADTIWALRNVSFDVKRGEVVGVIGRNGAGKSTLLKILSRITEPTTGAVDIYGRVGSLLEVGTGFHPELTGRENIFLNGSILGMKRVEIQNKFDELVSFAEVAKFIDTPVKHYSSGMYVRLAFAVAAHLETEVLVVDEVLSVGDITFQRKCLGKMGDVSKEGRTVLLVSHNIAAILSLCSRSIFLSGGQLIADGGSKSVVDHYLQALDSFLQVPLRERSDRQGNQVLSIVACDLLNSEGDRISCAHSGQDVTLALTYKSKGNRVLKNVHVAIGMHGRFDENLFHLSTSVNSGDFLELNPEGTIFCRIKCLPLQPGRYSFNLFCTENGSLADWIQNAGAIEVEAGDFFGSGKLPPAEQGAFIVQHSWSISPVDFGPFVNSAS